MFGGEGKFSAIRGHVADGFVLVGKKYKSTDVEEKLLLKRHLPPIFVGSIF